MKSIKIVVVGDGAVGKTCLCISYANHAFPPDYVPTVFENYSTSTVVNGITCGLTLWDTAGQEEYDRLRPLSYRNTDIFFVCFSVACKRSYSNVRSKWIPEIRHHSPDSIVILVGTKTDLRDNVEKPNGLKASSVKPLRFDQGISLANDVGAVRYFECSALTSNGVEDLFAHSVQTLLEKPLEKRDPKKCSLH